MFIVVVVAVIVARAAAAAVAVEGGEAPREVHGEGVVGLVARHEAVHEAGGGAAELAEEAGGRRRTEPIPRVHAAARLDVRGVHLRAAAPIAAAAAAAAAAALRPLPAIQSHGVRHDGAQEKRQRVAVQPAAAAAAVAAKGVVARGWKHQPRPQQGLHATIRATSSPAPADAPAAAPTAAVVVVVDSVPEGLICPRVEEAVEPCGVVREGGADGQPCWANESSEASVAFEEESVSGAPK